MKDVIGELNAHLTGSPRSLSFAKTRSRDWTTGRRWTNLAGNVHRARSLRRPACRVPNTSGTREP